GRGRVAASGDRIISRGGPARPGLTPRGRERTARPVETPRFSEEIYRAVCYAATVQERRRPPRDEMTPTRQQKGTASVRTRFRRPAGRLQGQINRGQGPARRQELQPQGGRYLRGPQGAAPRRRGPDGAGKPRRGGGRQP